MKRKHWLRMMVLPAAVATALPSGRASGQPQSPSDNAAVSLASELDKLQSTLFDSTKPSRDRDEAAKRLLQRGATDRLIDAFRSNKSDVQVPVARALAELENPPDAFLGDLIQSLQPQVSIELAEAASQALANYRENPQARAKLREFIVRGDVKAEGAKLAAVKALGTLNDRDTAQFLVETVLRGNVTQRLSDAAADALVEMTGLSQYGRDFGQWNQWWADERGKSPAQFLDERRAERERRFGQANAALRNLGSGIDKLMFDLYRQQKTDKDREELVLRLLKDPYAEMIAAGARLVEQQRNEAMTVSPAVVTQLRELIGHSSPDVRQKVAVAVKAINDPAAAKPLLAQLRQEKDPSVKAALMAALGPTKDLDAVPELIRLLDDVSFQVSESAARALADLAPEVAKSPELSRELANALVRTIDRTNNQRGSYKLRENVVAAMIPLKDPGLVQPLFRLLIDREGNTPTVRQRAIRALAAMNSTNLRSDIAQQLTASLGDFEPGVRLEAATALGIVGSAAQANALFASTDPSRERDPLVRDEAWKSLSSLFADFTARDLANWAANKFRDLPPEKQVTVYLALNEKWVRAGDARESAIAQEKLGTLYLGPELDKPDEAVGYLQNALSFWDGAGGKVSTENIQSNLMRAHLRAKHYKQALVFAAERIKLGRDPNKEVMGRLILGEVNRLDMANQFADALELLKEAKNVDLGTQYTQALDQRDREISGKIRGYQQRYLGWWRERLA